MIRFTTPTFKFYLGDIDRSKIKDVEITFLQHATMAKVEKELVEDNLEFDDETNSIELRMTQEEAGRFEPGSMQVQVRILTQDDAVCASDIVKIKVQPSLSEDILK